MGKRKSAHLKAPKPQDSSKSNSGFNWNSDTEALTQELLQDPTVRPILNEDLPAIRKLYPKGQGINSVLLGLMTPLQAAISVGKARVARLFLELNADPNLFTTGSSSCLNMACRQGDLPIVRNLISAGADVNRISDNEYSPLAIAAWYNHPEIVRVLLENGAELTPAQGVNPVKAAVENNSMAVMRCFQRLIDPDRLYKKFSLLGVACYFEREEMLDLLLENGANPNLGIQVPLAIAADKKRLRFVQKLLAAGAFPDQPSTDSCLMMAISRNARKIVQALLQTGLDPDRPRNSEGSTGLILAASLNQIPIGELLIEAGADVNLSRKNGSTPLLFAAQNGHDQMIRILLDAGANPNAARRDGLTPLMAAANKNRRRCVQALLNNGANPFLMTRTGETFHVYASFPQNWKTWNLLEKMGCGINAKNSKGNTLLHLAVCRRKKELVRFLMLQGADLTLKGSHGKTGLQLAIEMDLLEIARVLVQGEELTQKEGLSGLTQREEVVQGES